MWKNSNSEIHGLVLSIIGIFLIIPSAETLFKSSTPSDAGIFESLFACLLASVCQKDLIARILSYLPYITACSGCILCAVGATLLIKRIHRNLDQEAFALAGNISNTIAFFLLAASSLVIGTLALNPPAEKPDILRLSMFVAMVVLIAAIAMVFWAVYTVLDRANKRQIIHSLSERDIRHVTDPGDKKITLRALFDSSSRIEAYINDADSFFAEFVMGMNIDISVSGTNMVDKTKQIILICPPEAYAKISLKYEESRDISNLPDGLLFDVQFAKFSQAISAIFFFEKTKNESPHYAILFSPRTPIGDSKWFVFGTKMENAEYIYASYREIPKTPQICGMRKEDCREECKRLINGKCGHLHSGSDVLDIDWLRDCTGMIKEEFDRRWGLIETKQFFDFTDRTQTHKMMETFADRLSSLHAFDLTSFSAWCESGRLQSFLIRTKKAIAKIAPKVTLATEPSEDHFFGRVFIFKSRKELWSKHDNCRRLYEILELHRKNDDDKWGKGIIHTGVVYEEDIINNRASAWIVDFAVYNKSVTWDEEMKGQGAAGSIGGFTANRSIIKKYLGYFNQVWETKFPSAFYGEPRNILLKTEELKGDGVSSPFNKTRTPQEEAEFIMDNWEEIEKRVKGESPRPKKQKDKTKAQETKGQDKK